MSNLSNRQLADLSYVSEYKPHDKFERVCTNGEFHPPREILSLKEIKLEHISDFAPTVETRLRLDVRRQQIKIDALQSVVDVYQEEHLDLTSEGFGSAKELLSAYIELKNSEDSENDGIYDNVVSVAEKARPRDIRNVALKLSEELGELSQEINIAEGFLNKPEGKDGVIGEAVDVIITAMDIIWLQNPRMTEKQLLKIVKNKLDKWHSQSVGE